MWEEVHELVGDPICQHPGSQDAWHKEFLTASYDCIFEAQHPPQHLMMCRTTFLLQSDEAVRFPQETILELTTKKYITPSKALKMGGLAVLENKGLTQQMAMFKDFEMGAQQEEVSLSAVLATQEWELGMAHRFGVAESSIAAGHYGHFLSGEIQGGF